MLTLLSSMSAWGFGGSFAGPEGGAVPTGSATQIVVAPGVDQNVVIVTAQVSTTSDLALLLPVPGIVPGTSAPVLPDAFLRLEAFTAPRVEQLTCDELVDTFHWESPPGCASFDPERVVDLQGEDAVDSVPAAPNFSDVTVEVVVITPDELAEFLDVRNLVLDPDYAAALQPHLDAGEPLLTIHPTRPLGLGEWLPPVRFTMAAGEWVLPLTIGDAASTARHELIVHTVGVPAAAPSTPSLGGSSDDIFSLGYPSATVQSDCVLEPGQDASEWLAAERAAIAEERTVPSWVLEYDGPADRCAPCTAELLNPGELSVLGTNAAPEDTRFARLWFAWDPGALAEDPVLRFAPAEADADLRFLLYEEGLSAVYQPCGASQPDPDSAICENVRLPSDASGCDAPRSGVAPLAGLALVAALLSRRRRALAAPLVALLLVAGRAEAAPHDGSPRTEVQAGVALIGTDRLVPTGLDRGAPWLANPYVGLEVRRTLFAWKDGRTLGVMGALRGFAGKAAPWGDQGVVSFVVAEPTVSLDVRHGMLRERSPVWFGRYGADAALAIVDPSISPAAVRLTGGLHGGVGTWLGRGTQRTSLELRGTVFPRTDGYETSYDPNLGFPGFMFYPGTVNLWLLAGRVFY
jgi:Uncharacterized protein conserved in bacteria (DUF2330)